MIPHLDELHASKVDKGLVVIGVTGGKAQEIEAYIKDNAVHHPIACGFTADYGHRGIPHCYLIDTNGKVVWHGHPADLEDNTIDKALVGARCAYVAPGLDEVHALRRAKDHGTAYTKLKSMLDGGTLGARAAPQAQKWVQEYEAFVAAAVAKAEAAAASKDVFAEWAALQPLVDWYLGVPGSECAKQRLDALLADPKNKREIEAGRKLAAGKDKEVALEYDAAYAIWKELASAFGNTKAGKEAAGLMKAYEKDGKLGFDKTCPYCQATGTACASHRKKKK